MAKNRSRKYIWNSKKRLFKRLRMAKKQYIKDNPQEKEFWVEEYIYRTKQYRLDLKRSKSEKNN